MTTHLVKCDRSPFVAAWTGAKRAEFRKNDRQYEVGDLVMVQEVTNNGDSLPVETGNALLVRITHVSSKLGQWCEPLQSATAGEWCVWSFEVLYRFATPILDVDNEDAIQKLLDSTATEPCRSLDQVVDADPNKVNGEPKVTRCWDCGKYCLANEQPADATVPLCDACWVAVGKPRPGKQAKPCRFEYLGPECGYCGPLLRCEKTLADCIRHGNEDRFGGEHPGRVSR